MICSIVVATCNVGKLREIREVLSNLSVDVIGLDKFPDVVAPEEHGSTFAANARLKAIYYAELTGRWCLADDSGIVVDALAGRPGVLSARYAADLCPPEATREQIDSANNTKLLNELKGVGDAERTARYVCHLALADEHEILIETSGTMEGRIAHHLLGCNGFGYDPLFIAHQTGCTVAELTGEQKNQISHRGKAVRKFAKLLGELLAGQRG